MNRITVHDPTLRDGSHAVSHQLTREQLRQYAQWAEEAGLPSIEVGHGNGLGASSLQLGESLLADAQMLEICRAHLRRTQLAVHVMPGFATVRKDLRGALDAGVDLVRVASHCTEADITRRHIEYVRSRGKTVHGVLMMSHMTTPAGLAEEALKMQSYGAQGIIIMDSAGAYLPRDVSERIRLLGGALSIPVGFHAHNNLGLAVANSIAAAEAGAAIVDGTMRGFGAGAGNTQMEALIAALHRSGFETGIDLIRLLKAADRAERSFVRAPHISSSGVASGMAGVFSGFAKPVERIAAQYGLHPADIFIELGRRQIIAGQEDLILEIADELARSGKAGA